MPRDFSFKKINHLFKLEELNPPRSIRSWGRYISAIYEGRCIVTGRSSTETPLEIHHLFSNYLLETNKVSPKDSLSLKFSVLNGVTLEKSLHKRFHTEYGNRVTPLMFHSFLAVLEKENSSLDKQRIKEVKSWILCLYRELTLVYPVVRSLKL